MDEIDRLKAAIADLRSDPRPDSVRLQILIHLVEKLAGLLDTGTVKDYRDHTS